MRFCRMQWLPTWFYGSLSVYSRPLPSEKIAPLQPSKKSPFGDSCFTLKSESLNGSLPQSRTSFFLLDWGVKKALSESHQNFEVATARTSGLVKSFVLAWKGLFECEHTFFDKPMVITEPPVPSARWIGLGSKLYPSSMQRIHNNTSKST